MERVLMNERDLNRIEVLILVAQGRMTVVAAEQILGLSRRTAEDVSVGWSGGDPSRGATFSAPERARCSAFRTRLPRAAMA